MQTTINQLEAIVTTLNHVTKSPVDTFRKRRKNGRYPFSVGHYMLNRAYGGNQLVRVMNEGGGQHTVSVGGFLTKSALYDQVAGMVNIVRELKGA